MPKLRTALTVTLAMLTTLLVTLLTTVVGTVSAFAQVPPADPAGSMTMLDPTAPMPTTVTHSGSPIWVFVLVAGATMAVTAAVTLLAALRLRPGRSSRAAAA